MIDKQTIIELEFDAVKHQLSRFCLSEGAKRNALKISPFDSFDQLENSLSQLEEMHNLLYVAEMSFPGLYFTELSREFDLMRIEGGVLSQEQVLNVLSVITTTLDLVKFTRKHKVDYPLMYELTEHMEGIPELVKIIQRVIDIRGNIKDDASPELESLRQSISLTHKEINKKFESVLRKYKKDEIIGDIEEAFLENRRLLSVLSSHKKRVAGRSYGTSAGGSLTYKEPIETRELNDKKEQLEINERNEVQRILAELTDRIRGQRKNIEAYQRLIIRFDLLKGKAILAKELNAILPNYGQYKELDIKDAKHPLLYLNHKNDKTPTIGQDIYLNSESRFLVISGPNAGGKSITLKTIGLLQIMHQSGLFVPVAPHSKMGWFENVFSDIGDNQSIENRLSTYSYRLNRMKFFLDHVDDNSLILLDEFGSGSDPELGGALAEIIFETLYEKNCFCVITTHYANIKLLTSSLPQATNACMLFDTEKLEPLYKLSIGQPGSSFTFEVATLNNLPEDLIKSAKQRVNQKKVKLDKLTVELQRKKSEYEALNKSHKKGERQANHLIREFEAKMEKLKLQAQKQSKYFEQQHKYISTGKKIYEFIRKFKKHKTNKKLNEEVTKFVAIEKGKALEKEKAVVLQPELKPVKDLEITTEIQKDQAPKKKEKQIKAAPVVKVYKPKNGDRIRVLSTGQKGEVVSIEKSKIFVEVGNFKLQVKLSDIEKIG